MLQRIRDNASGPLAYVVVAVITLVFGVWGIGSYFTPSSDPVVANVGGTDITRNQLQRAYDQRYQRLRQMMGDNFDPSVISSEQLRRTVLQSMINNEVLNQYAQEAGYRVTDAGLLAAIRGNPQFQSDGNFSAQRYRGLLAQAGIAPAQYEASLRDDLKSRQLRGEISQTAFASPAEVDQAYRLANQERRMRYLAFDPVNYKDAVEVSDDEIQSYYDDNGDAFQTPERVKLSYVSLDRASAQGGASAPDEQTLRDLFEQNKSQFGDAEQRGGAQIRVAIEGDGSAARQTIQELAQAEGDLEARAEGVEGAEFSAIDSAQRADLSDAVGDALFELEEGETSSPVKAEDGWYLVALSDVTPATEPKFDDPDVQAQLKAIASAQQAQQAFADKTERLESLAYEAPNDLKTLADELDLEIQTTDWVTREQGPGIGQYDAVRKAAFSDAVLMDELNSTPIQLGAERRVVLRVSEHEQAKRKPMEAVRDEIRTRVTERKASQQAREAAQAALDKAESGTQLDELTADSGAALESPGFVRRTTREVDARVREAAFNVPKPSADKPRYQITATSDGQIALVGVDDVREASSDESETPRRQFARQQRDYISQLEYAALGDFLRSQVDVEINEDRLN
ncbi:peptidyl-prolyl cis-trans isomerase ppiD [Salinisphaera dokdonensis CL-ES53]|uniref:Periplasmic chaperone PpiD n=1 Tax=Salinisphaera dokdonensis CL-ES53 TaxID=1304272 RepID=A0ABV2B446_9GAMM